MTSHETDEWDVPESEPDDRDLIHRVRNGDKDAFADLWSRHETPARSFAERLTRTFDADDLVSEAFTRIFTLLQAGKGPDGPFRPYLYVTIRNTAASWARRNREVSNDEPEDIPDPRATDTQILADVDAELTVRALKTLPERWQRILWYTEVEGLSAQAVAEKLNMTANSAAALSYRAREGLRQAWIQMHIDASAAGSEHRWALEHVGKWARKSLSARAERRMTAHLESCGNCSVIASEARATSATFTSTTLPLAVGITGTAGLGWTALGSTSQTATSTNAGRDNSSVRSIVRRVRKQPAATVAIGVLTALVAAGAIASTTDRTSVTPRKPVPEAQPAPQIKPLPSSEPSRQPTPPQPTPPQPTPPQPTPLGERSAASPTSSTVEPRKLGSAQPPKADQVATPPRSPEAKPTTPESDAANQPRRLSITSIDTAGTALYPVVSGTATPDAIVTLSARNRTIGTVRANAGGRWRSSELDTLPAGRSRVTASDSTTSDSQYVTLTRPAVSIAFRGNQATVAIFGIPNVEYIVTWDDLPIGSGIANEAGYVVISGMVRTAGTHKLTVQATAQSRTGPRTTHVAEQ